MEACVIEDMTLLCNLGSNIPDVLQALDNGTYGTMQQRIVGGRAVPAGVVTEALPAITEPQWHTRTNPEAAADAGRVRGSSVQVPQRPDDDTPAYVSRGKSQSNKHIRLRLSANAGHAEEDQQERHQRIEQEQDDIARA